MKRSRAALGFALGAVLSGCASEMTFYRIPDNADALAAFRQCMTVPNAVNLEPCLASIPQVNKSSLSLGGAQGGNAQKYKDAMLAVGNGCRILADYSVEGNEVVVQACVGSDLGLGDSKADSPNK